MRCRESWDAALQEILLRSTIIYSIPSVTLLRARFLFSSKNEVKDLYKQNQDVRGLHESSNRLEAGENLSWADVESHIDRQTFSPNVHAVLNWQVLNPQPVVNFPIIQYRKLPSIALPQTTKWLWRFFSALFNLPLTDGYYWRLTVSRIFPIKFPFITNC